MGSARIILQFDLNRDIDGAARDVQAAINAARSNLPTLPQAVHGEEDHRRGKQRQQLTEQQPADNRDAQRVTQLRTNPRTERQRHRADRRWPVSRC